MSKWFIFVAKSFLGNLHRHLAIFYWSHCCYVTDKLFLAILGFISGRTYIYPINVNDLNAVIHLLFFCELRLSCSDQSCWFFKENFLSSTGLEPLRLAWRISHEDRLHPADPSGLFLLCFFCKIFLLITKHNITENVYIRLKMYINYTDIMNYKLQIIRC